MPGLRVHMYWCMYFDTYICQYLYISRSYLHICLFVSARILVSICTYLCSYLHVLISISMYACLYLHVS